MKTVTINLYSFNELGEDSKQKAINEHQDFLDSEPIDCEDENGNLVSEYHEHSEDEAIDSILANEYTFFFDGSLASCVTYTGKHPKAGITEFNFKNQVYTL